MVSLGLTFCWRWKDELWKWTVSAAFRACRTEGALTGTDSGQRRLGSYGGPLRSRNDHKVVAQCGSLSGLWRGSGWCRSSREEFCCAGMDMWIRGRVKQKAAPKDPFRIAADRISFGNVAAIYQCFKMGKFYFIFALNIITFWLISSKLMNGFILFWYLSLCPSVLILQQMN